MKKVFLLASIISLSITAWCNARLPKLFGDSMVLQRDGPIPVWGWADKGETITVTFNKQVKTTKAGADGRWKITLANEAAGGPYQLTVKGKNSVVLKDVMVGEVWICSGQSNMEWPVSASNNAAQEIRSAANPLIRHFKVKTDIGEKPKEDLAYAGNWATATPATAGSFTAVGYFFARELYQQLHVPIGLINTTWGGTHVETWTSRGAFESSDEFREMIKRMPSLNLDSLAKERKAAGMKKLQTLQGGLPDANSVASFRSLSFNDKSWPQIKLPALWESSSLPDFDGVVWFRKTVTLTAAEAGKEGELRLGPIDDNDETYINGVKLGETKAYNAQRVYAIPANVLKEGVNVIAVRVEDTGGGGGLYGKEEDLQIVVAGNAKPLSGTWVFQVEKMFEGTTSLSPNAYPTLLYNAMLNPLVPFAFRGVIWYQGESNADRAAQYRKAFPLLIQDWRRQWKAEFPFYFVQLASFNAGNGDSKSGSAWAELREAQTATLSLPHTGMAVTTDIGESGDIHPRNKQDVGKRLAAIALHNDYGKNVVFSGPSFSNMLVDGTKAILSFENIGGGLVTHDKYGYLRGFEVAGDDKAFHYAKAFIDGNRVVVMNDSVQHPVAVRYAWADDAGEANLFNKEGFPAQPFRTDDWKGVTEGVKYSIANN